MAGVVTPDMALIAATQNGDEQAVRTALDSGANVHADRDLALRIAVLRDNLPIANLLLSRGADVHVENDAPLMIAIDKRSVPMADLLIKYGAYVNAIGGSPIERAIINKDLPMVKLLVSNGADIKAETSIIAAILMKDTDIVKYLLDNGATISVYTMWSIITMATPSMIKFLVDHGAPVNKRVIDGAQNIKDPERRQEVLNILQNRSSPENAILSTITSRNQTELNRLAAQGVLNRPDLPQIFHKAALSLIKQTNADPEDTLRWLKWLIQYGA